ncbi:hypothetical protein HMI54_004025 [Coelomomyces lativittatus]|nr:hypothetical protein HMI54_004025 [Coelomomyces lativittatus]KAJ1509341.1 hypothetical protein HMI56_006843 [Coelomomyces lativittatus]KAJ1512504.1 hypothetical protein HMI55_006206 [Coelomomyces lativittatus]
MLLRYLKKTLTSFSPHLAVLMTFMTLLSFTESQFIYPSPYLQPTTYSTPQFEPASYAPSPFQPQPHPENYSPFQPQPQPQSEGYTPSQRQHPIHPQSPLQPVQSRKRRKKLEEENKDNEFRDMLSVLPNQFFDRNMETHFNPFKKNPSSISSPSPSSSSSSPSDLFFTPKDIHSPNLNPIDRYVSTKGFLNDPKLEMEMKKFSMLHGHDLEKEKVINQKLMSAPFCDQDIWISYYQNITERLLDLYPKLSLIVDKTKEETSSSLLELSKLFLTEFTLVETLYSFLIANQELKTFVEKMYQYCPGIEGAKDGAWVYLHASISFMHHFNHFALHSARMLQFNHFLLSHQVVFLNALTLYHTSYSMMHYFYIYFQSTFQSIFSDYSKRASTFSEGDETYYRMAMEHGKDDVIKAFTLWNCTVQQVQSDSLSYQYDPEQDEALFLKTFEGLLSDVFVFFYSLPNLKIHPPFSSFEILSYQNLLSLTLVADPEKYCGHSNSFQKKNEIKNKGN